uniref:Uncharacterized protein n=1 Tax=Ditylenchus dipsaci TaxID=166011 RepID=A0A915D7A6_9BILA
MAMNEQAKKVVPYLKRWICDQGTNFALKRLSKRRFRHIYKVTDVRFDMTFAVKVSFRRLEPLRMILEQKILLALSDQNILLQCWPVVHVKPSNVCIGIQQEKNIRRLYLVTSVWPEAFDRLMEAFDEKRAYAGIRGTIRYISLNIHDKGDHRMIYGVCSIQ